MRTSERPTSVVVALPADCWLGHDRHTGKGAGSSWTCSRSRADRRLADILLRSSRRAQVLCSWRMARPARDGGRTTRPRDCSLAVCSPARKERWILQQDRHQLSCARLPSLDEGLQVGAFMSSLSARACCRRLFLDEGLLFSLSLSRASSCVGAAGQLCGVCRFVSDRRASNEHDGGQEQHLLLQLLPLLPTSEQQRPASKSSLPPHLAASALSIGQHPPFRPSDPRPIVDPSPGSSSCKSRVDVCSTVAPPVAPLLLPPCDSPAAALGSYPPSLLAARTVIDRLLVQALSPVAS